MSDGFQRPHMYASSSKRSFNEIIMRDMGSFDVEVEVAKNQVMSHFEGEVAVDDIHTLPMTEDENDELPDDSVLPDTDEDMDSVGFSATTKETSDDSEDDENHYPSTQESSDEELGNLENPKKRKRKAITGDLKNSLICLGQEFNSGTEFKDFLMKYSLYTGYDIKVDRSESHRISAICSNRECEWRVYCSVDSKSEKWQVKVIKDKHTCAKHGRTKMLKIGEITRLFLDRIRKKPKLKAAEIKDEIKREFNMTVSKNMCSKAKRKALAIVRGSYKSQFGPLKNYAAELRRSNPETTAELQTKGTSLDGHDIFHRLYICFGILKSSWKANCRPVIGLDGCFLKWDTHAQLLCAVGRDASNRIYPIAWAVVDIENSDNWEWFITHMKEDLDLDKGDGLTIISDKQKGLLNAMGKVLPLAEHRMCARHIYSNWRKIHREGMLKPIFWQVARSFNETAYNESMEVIKQFNYPAYSSLVETEPQTWCRAFFKSTSHCPDVLNNLSESFNNTIKEARTKPVLDMLEDIRRATMDRITSRSASAMRRTEKFTKKAMVELEKSRETARECSMFSSTGGIFEIEHQGLSYPVSLQERTCDCRVWDLTGIPCMHAICAINENRLNVEDYVSEFYLTSKLQATYRKSLNPIRRLHAWPKVDDVPVTAPINERKKAGRPRKHDRKKAAHESPSKTRRLDRSGYKKRCSHCQEMGHSKTTCPNKEKPSVPKPTTSRPRGRPRKKVEEAGPSKPPSRPSNMLVGGSTSESVDTLAFNTRHSSSASQQCSSQAPFPSQDSHHSYSSTYPSQGSYNTVYPQQQPYPPFYPNFYHPQPYPPSYPNVQQEQPYRQPRPNQGTLGRRRERVPQGYGLYVNTQTNNMFFRRGKGKIERIP